MALQNEAEIFHFIVNDITRCEPEDIVVSEVGRGSLRIKKETKSIFVFVFR